MFFSRRPDSKLILLIELQSSLVRGSIVQVGGSSPVIELSRTMDIAFSGRDSGASYMQAALPVIASLASSLLKDYSLRANGADRVRIGAAHFVLSSPWTVSRAKVVSMAFERETPVTQERVRSIVESERANTGLDPSIPADVIEEKIFDVKLNGYSIAEWAGKSARMLDIAYAMSVGSAASMKALRETVSNAVDVRHVYFHSSLLLQYMSLRQATIPGTAYALVHVHGELTDLVIVRQGMCSFFGTLPIGADTIVRKLGEASHLAKKAAESLVSLYIGGHMDPAEDARTAAAVRHAMSAWSQELPKLMRAGGDTLPSSLFLIAQSHEELFETALRTIFPHTTISRLSVDMTSAYAAAVSVIS